ncbi:MAG: tellurite resistance TerB family protein [Gammaproteobacteria bacterium]|nr:tellurite resistance TerB family protein [Gammaproteobacteria bacterium]
MDPQRLLEQFLGAGTAGKVSDAARQAKSGLASSGAGGLVGGLAAGGLLGLLMGNKKVRKKVGKLAGGAVGYGGAAALGALGYRAYQQWQSGQQAAPVDTTPPPDALPQEAAKFMPGAAPASDGRPFELVLVMAMIAAANADGHIGPEEQRNIFDQVGQLPLDAEDKAFIFDTLGSPPALADIAALAQGPEQATELYLASRLAIDVDHPAEQAYLDALAARLALPPELVAHLEAQAVGADRADSA